MNEQKQVMSKEVSTSCSGLNNTSMTIPPVYQNPATTVMSVPAETYYADVSEIKILLKLLLEQKDKKSEEIANESTISSLWKNSSSSLIPVNNISQKQIDKIINMESMAAFLLTQCSNLKVELQRNQQPSKRKKLKPTVNLKIINNLIKIQTSTKKLTA